MNKRIAVAFLLAVALVAPLTAQDPEVVRLGMVDSMIKDLSPGQKKFIDSEFVTMVKDFTGLKSRVILGSPPVDAVKKLDAGEWDFACMHGVEYARVQAKNPKLVPLMIAVYKEPTIHAFLLVNKDNAAAGFADLKGKDISLLSRVHCDLFAEKNVKSDPSKFFGKIVRTTNVEDALDDILLDKVAGSIVDSAGLGIYKDINPGRFNRLKVLAKSETFPPSVVAYQEGKLSPKLLKDFRDGMLKANTSDKGKEVMATFKISSFELVPEDMQMSLDAILKAYPTPK